MSNQAMGFKETSTTHRSREWVETRLKLITQMAKGNPRCRFNTLAHLLNEDFLEQCFEALKKDKACGIDGMTIEEYKVNIKERLKDLVDRMKAKQYYPQPVRRVHIPRPDGKMRELGIPAIEDKIVQMGIKRILEAIFEVDFSDSSYGFRPNRSCHDALKALDETIMTSPPINVIVDMDIERFFDTVDHKWMMKCLEQRIKDPSLLRLIVRFLKSGIMEGGKYYEVDRGTPQGGVLSPMLANIYLHFVLDLWFERETRKQIKGFAKLIRYADDFVFCLENRDEAEKLGEMLRQRLAKFGLKIAEGKSRVIKFGRKVWEESGRKGEKVETFDFLGFTHYCGKSRRGKFKVGRKTSKKKFRQKITAMNEWLRNVRNSMKQEQWWKILKLKLTGHYRYYGISDNMTELMRFYKESLLLAYRWLNRRSQRKSLTYAQYRQCLANTLPKPKIYHRLYGLASV